MAWQAIFNSFTFTARTRTESDDMKSCSAKGPRQRQTWQRRYIDGKFSPHTSRITAGHAPAEESHYRDPDALHEKNRLGLGGLRVGAAFSARGSQCLICRRGDQPRRDVVDML